LSGVGKICAIFGKKRQAYYRAEKRHEKRSLQGDLIVEKVKQLRGLHPRMGCLKLHHKLKDFLDEHHIKLGEKKFRELMRKYGLLVRKHRRYVRTTDSNHNFRKYENLIKDKIPERAEEIWVTDMTTAVAAYIKSFNNFSYLSLVTDAYSKKLMGWSLRNSLTMEGPLDALRMALANRKYPDRELIHHSDRGIQYCSRPYIKLLRKNEIAISMTQTGDPYDNILAERMNNTVKNELLEGSGLGTLHSGNRKLGKLIRAYNSGRPHWSLDFRTPNEVHALDLKVKKRWKKKKYEKRKKMSLFEKYKKLNPDNPLFNPL